MEGKIIKIGELTQSKIIEGVVKTVDAVKITIGPAGKGVALDTGMGVDITRDGASVAKIVKFKDREMNMGAELVKKAAELTETQAGDGTSSTSILIKELCLKGQKAIATGANVNEVKSGMIKTQKWLTEYIKKNSIEVNGDLEKIRKVATISANNDPEVGELVVRGLEKVGINGLITADMASGLDTVVDVTDGMKLDRGWASPQYVTNPEDGTCILENPYILVVGETLSTIPQIINFFEDYQKNGNGRPLLIICDDIDESINVMLIMNTLHGALKCCVVKGIDYGDARKNIMEDIAVAVGANHICPENGIQLAQATVNDLGQAGRVIVNRDSCIIYEGLGDKEMIQERAKILESRLNDPATTEYDKTKFEKRVANLVGGIAIIKAGGASEAEKLNRKATIEDSILASKSAIAEGCVPGGGYIYFRAVEAIKKDKAFWKTLDGDEREGAEIVVKSLPVVMKTIIDNCGESSDVIMNKVRSSKPGIGFNAKTKKFENLVESGVLDSSKVLRVSLENSISTASMILLIDCTIIDDEEETKNNDV
jgi:chaperonin GroEL